MNGISTLKTSANARNPQGREGACLQLHDLAEDLRSILPAPSQALTDQVSAARSELRMAVQPCLNAGPNPSQNEISTAEMQMLSRWLGAADVVRVSRDELGGSVPVVKGPTG